MEDKKKLQKIFKIITIIVTILLVAFIIYGIHLGIFKDKKILVDYMKNFGIWAFLFFIILQAIQVVFPVIPGGASCLAGVLAFGPVLGFIYNYLGLVIGSVLAFLISRKYGERLVKQLFSEETVNKYLSYIKTKKFDKIFFWGIFLPGFPDDLLCYVAGLSKMNFKTFIFYIIIGKPLALIMYSVFINFL